MKPELSIIVVSYNTRELTLACLESVRAQTHGIKFELLVVDNASSDGSADAIAQLFSDATLFPLQQNVGFAAANNFAARHARGDWILLLNPDTVVLSGAVTRLLEFARSKEIEDSSAAIFGGRTLFPDGTLNPTSCWGRPTPWSAFCRGSGLSHCFAQSRVFNPEAFPDWPRDTVRTVDIITGCFLLVRRSTWEKLGGFSADFFMYGEEADFCLRARASGLRCYFCPDAAIIHYGGASERVRADKMVRLFTAKARLFRNHWPGYSAAFGTWTLSLWAWSRLVAYSIAKSFGRDCQQALNCWRSTWQRRSAWRDQRPMDGTSQTVIGAAHGNS